MRLNRVLLWLGPVEIPPRIARRTLRSAWIILILPLLCVRHVPVFGGDIEMLISLRRILVGISRRLLLESPGSRRQCPVVESVVPGRLIPIRCGRLRRRRRCPVNSARIRRANMRNRRLPDSRRLRIGLVQIGIGDLMHSGMFVIGMLEIALCGV